MSRPDVRRFPRTAALILLVALLVLLVVASGSITGRLVRRDAPAARPVWLPSGGAEAPAAHSASRPASGTQAPAGLSAQALGGAREFVPAGDSHRPESRGARTSSSFLTALGIAAATLGSEDLTCIGTGLLVQREELSLVLGIAACFAGIYIGDLGLWLAGRLIGGRLFAWRALRTPLVRESASRFGAWFDRNAGAAIIASRFLPGTRLPLYLAAGATGRSGWRFALWTFIAGLLWAPPVVFLTARFGGAFVRPFERAIGGGWLPFAAAGILLLTLLRIVPRLATREGRSGLWMALERVRQWEFWPAWLFYPPVGLWIALLSLRYGGFTTVTAANPGIPHGGFVGESKHRILSSLPPRWTIPSALIEPAPFSERLARLARAMEERGWKYPLILKPDVGERGGGVKLVRSACEAEAYLARFAPALLAQPYHPGPHEAGIFYAKVPGAGRGRIFSITDKRFPAVVGDGKTTVEALIRRHPRYRMQAATFLARHAGSLGRVLREGETFPLGVAGNHVQGTMFLDGSWLATPDLERRMDEIAQSIEGFYFGRFDVRYGDIEAFRGGEDLAIVELNGVTSESTNIYDPARSLMSAYATLFRQWSLLFRIGAINRRRGTRTTPALELARATLNHYAGKRRLLPAD